jgi:hypothetical protein
MIKILDIKEHKNWQYGDRGLSYFQNNLTAK